MTDRLADAWPVLLVAVLVVGVALGWAAHVTWIRGRVRVDQLGDGQWRLLIGRAVAGIWPTQTRAVSHQLYVRRQIGGRQ